MIAKVFIDGRYIGEVKYKLPVEEGRQIPLPHKEHERSSVQVLVITEDEEDKLWWVSKHSPLSQL